MVVAQEMLGRPYLAIYGIKLTTVVWILIAVALGLIFWMTMKPEFWKKILREDKKKGKQMSKMSKILLMGLIVLVITSLLFVAGTIAGFNHSYDTLMNKQGCSEISCNNYYPSIDCETCICRECADRVEVLIPVG